MRSGLWMLGIALAVALVVTQIGQGDGEGLLYALLRLVGWLT